MLKTVNINIREVFPYEKDLENFLKHYPETLEEGMVVLDQQRRDSSAKRADLLCLDKEGQLVVVEVKIVTAPRDSVMQLLGYLHEVNKERQALFQEFQSKKKYRHMVHQRPRGIIVAPQFSQEVSNALEFVKENTIELRLVKSFQAIDTGEKGAILLDTRPDTYPSLTEGDVIKNTNNTALQKISDEIITFTRALGGPGEIITSVSTNRIVFKCSATFGATQKAFLYLHAQRNALKLDYKIDPIPQSKFATERIVSAKGWDEDIQTKIKDAHLIAQS